MRPKRAGSEVLGVVLVGFEGRPGVVEAPIPVEGAGEPVADGVALSVDVEPERAVEVDGVGACGRAAAGDFEL